LAQAERAKAAFTIMLGIRASIFIRNSGGNTGGKSGGKPGDNPANNPRNNPGFLIATLPFSRVYNRPVLPASLLTRAVVEFPGDFHEGSS
jgi:hypothetical protein